MSAKSPHLVPVGGGGGAGAYATPALVGACALCGVWAAWAWLAPMTPGDNTEAHEVARVTLAEFDRSAMDDRRDDLSALLERNVYARSGGFWQEAADREDSDTTAEEQAARDAEEQDATAALVNNIVRSSGDGTTTIALTDEDDLSDDVKSARDNLLLRGIFRTRAGDPAAIVGYKVSAPSGKTVAVRAGDVFVDDKNERAPWAVGRIDPAGKRVVLVRSGAVVALELFPDRTEIVRDDRIVVESSSASPEPAGAQPPTIEERTTEEIIDELRASGISEQDIITILQLMERTPSDDPGVEASLPEPEPRAPSIDAEAATEATNAAPAGLEGLMQLMQEVEREQRERRRAREEPGEPDEG